MAWTPFSVVLRTMQTRGQHLSTKLLSYDACNHLFNTRVRVPWISRMQEPLSELVNRTSPSGTPSVRAFSTPPVRSSLKKSRATPSESSTVPTYRSHGASITGCGATVVGGFVRGARSLGGSSCFANACTSIRGSGSGGESGIVDTVSGCAVVVAAPACRLCARAMSRIRSGANMKARMESSKARLPAMMLFRFILHPDDSIKCTTRRSDQSDRLYGKTIRTVRKIRKES